MADAGIDLNRGVTQRRAPNNVLVSMYKDSPGTFYDEVGDPVDDGQAQEAGFDVRALQREKRKLEKIAAAKDRIEAEADAEVAAIEAEEEPVRKNLHAEHRGAGRYDVLDEAGNGLENLVSRDEADRLVREANHGR